MNNGKAITISDGTSVIVDAEDYEELTRHKWSANGNGYAVRGVHIGNRKYRKIYMHRQIMGAEKNQIVDHVNGDTTDNRKSNLRIASKSENAANSKLNSNNTSGYRGVIFDRGRGKWRAEIKRNYRNIHIGYFETGEQAAQAYNDKAIELFGDFAKLNTMQEVAND